MLTKNEVNHIAKLARLGLSDEEVEKFQGELSSILDYVSQLQEADLSNTEPISNITGAKNVLRKDLSRQESNAEEVNKILGEAPDTQGGYIKVRAVF